MHLTRCHRFTKLACSSKRH